MDYRPERAELGTLEQKLAMLLVIVVANDMSEYELLAHTLATCFDTMANLENEGDDKLILARVEELRIEYGKHLNEVYGNE